MGNYRSEMDVGSERNSYALAAAHDKPVKGLQRLKSALDDQNICNTAKV